MSRTSLIRLKADRAQLMRALEDARNGKLANLSIMERDQLADQIEQRLEEVTS